MRNQYNGIGNFVMINSQELRTDNFRAILRGRGKDTDGPIGNGIGNFFINYFWKKVIGR